MLGPKLDSTQSGSPAGAFKLAYLKQNQYCPINNLKGFEN